MKLLLIHDIFNFLFLIAGIIIGLLFKTKKIHIGDCFKSVYPASSQDDKSIRLIKPGTVAIPHTIFKQDLFDFFVNNHDLHLLDGEMNDIINFVNQHYPVNLLQCSDNELLNLFDKTINEMNRRKAAGVWVGGHGE